MFIFKSGFSPFSRPQPHSTLLGGGLLFNGCVCVFFSILIFVEPDLVAYFIASLLMVVGISLLSTWRRMRRVIRR